MEGLSVSGFTVHGRLTVHFRVCVLTNFFILMLKANLPIRLYMSPNMKGVLGYYLTLGGMLRLQFLIHKALSPQTFNLPAYLDPNKICKLMTFMAIIRGLGLLFYILLEFPKP